MAGATATAPPAKPPVTQSTWFERAEEFLTKHGWTRARSDPHGNIWWNDPLGTLEPGKEKVIGTFKRAEGAGVQELKQLHIAPLPWTHLTERAVDIQKARIKQAEKEAQEKEIQDKKEAKEKAEAAKVKEEPKT